jgi:hypothetical protein
VAILASSGRAISIACSQIPYAKEQGIILAEQGILAKEQGFLSANAGLVAG